MRYVYIFDDTIDNEQVQVLIDVICSYEQVDLFFTTPGGSLTAMRTLIHAINQHPDIQIFLTGYIASAGTFLLTECTQPVYLHEDLDFILFHMADRMIEGTFRKKAIDDRIIESQTRATNEDMGRKYKALGLTAKELKRYYAGEDVVLYKSDFPRLKVARNE